MLTYAGQPLVVAGPDLRQKVEDLLSLENVYEHARLHWNANEAFPTQLGVVVDHHIEIGKLFWPSGASRWAVGHFLVYQTEAEAIEAAGLGPSTLKMTWEEGAYTNGEETSTTTVDSIEVSMYALPLRPITLDDDRSLYLLTLVDQRFFWWSRNTGNLITRLSRVVNHITLSNGGSGYTSAPTVSITGGSGTGAAALAKVTNGVVTEVWITDSGSGYLTTPSVGFSGGGGSGAAATATVGQDTWLTTYGKLLSFTGAVPEHDAPGASYLDPSTWVRLLYEPLPPWLDTIAWNTGQRIVLALDGSVSLQNPTTTAPEDTEGVLAGGDFLGTVAATNTPASGVGVFPDLSSGSFQGGYNVQTAGGSGTIGTAVLRSPIFYDGTNSGSLSSLTSQFLTDFSTWQTGTLDTKLAGIVNVSPNGTYGNIIWTYRRDELSTRVEPCDYTVRIFQPQPESLLGTVLCSKACLKVSYTPRPYSPPYSKLCSKAKLMVTQPSQRSLLSAKLCSKECVTATWSSVIQGQLNLTSILCSSSCLTARFPIPTITPVANETTAVYLDGVWTVGIVDPLIATKGGTGQSTVTQGDLLYGGTNVWSKLAKSTTATRYLSNQGASNDPSWNQVNLSDGVTGTLPAANGGTGITSYGTAYYILGMNGAGNALEYKNFVTGTSGTDFTITPSAALVTFNLPDASASARGVVSTSSQSFAGQKTFENGSGVISYGGFNSWGSTGPGTTRLTMASGASNTGSVQLTNGGGALTPLVTLTFNSGGNSLVVDHSSSSVDASIYLVGPTKSLVLTASSIQPDGSSGQNTTLAAGETGTFKYGVLTSKAGTASTASGTFTTTDGKTVTVSNGIITSIV